MKELNYYGIHACLALWEKRRQDIVRVYLDESNVKSFSPLLKWCAGERKVYRIVPLTELNKVADSIHHEGICIHAKALPPLTEAEFRVMIGKAPQKICLLYLDGVQNPHNIGSIIRTAAHFGAPYILGEKLPSLSPSACRIAKGGSEIVRLVSLSSPLDTLRWLKTQGFAFAATSSHRGTSLFKHPFSLRTILAMGSESDGVSEHLLKHGCSIQIPGTDAIESLNVSVATALCLGEYARQHRC